MTVFGSGDLPPPQIKSSAGRRTSLAWSRQNSWLCEFDPPRANGAFIYQFRPSSSMKNPDKAVPFPPMTEAVRRYRAAQFFNSVNAFEQLPPDIGQEVAFAGRSNAGKSSALNLLTGQRQLARVSKTPGRTQMINFFQVEAERYLVDLPGYGYAQAPEAMRRLWGVLLERYLRERIALRGLLLMMDIRHPLTELDQRMLDCCVARALPAHLLLTKTDKLSRGAAKTVLQQVQKTLYSDYPHATAQLFSAQNGQGIDEAHQRLDGWLGY